jgi:hypothetical protein
VLVGGRLEDAKVGTDGEALGRGGRGARWWRAGVRHRRKWHSPIGRRGAEEVGVRGWAEGWCGGARGWAERGWLGGRTRSIGWVRGGGAVHEHGARSGCARGQSVGP